MVTNEIIRVSAVVLRDQQGRVLTVRKRGTARFMLPGGKPEAGETPAETALREVQEELLVDLAPADLRHLGTFEADAANEASTRVHAEVFVHPTVPVGDPAAEIDELRWLDLTEPRPGDLAPLLEHHVLPALEAV